MGIPNLLLVKSYKQSDTNVEKLFIDMVSAFILRNGLRESILGQIPEIMVLAYVHTYMYVYIQCIIVRGSWYLAKFVLS